ncbi:hypothetical protein FE633_12850 [Streptomyces montanus]|uniref:DUF222 domain-containing protein n=1 Tax=Streptomyces montanus TaxID=2580423 RepID=A0A5R9FUU8_9ACTN|nr:hypothetical protein [Streptomyces montanus]TLS45660.1 hypothetical protein FE633_12850 [Streptomyces montanus]
MYGETAANAKQRVIELLDAAGASPAEVHTLIAAIQAGAVEGAQGEVIELDTQSPSDSNDQVHEGWLRAVEAITDRLAHIADRTVRQARAKAVAEHRGGTRVLWVSPNSDAVSGRTGRRPRR